MAKRSVRRTNSKLETDIAEPVSTLQSPEPSEEEIRHRAYQRYLRRGGGDGQAFDDWLEAEQELKSQGASLKAQEG